MRFVTFQHGSEARPGVVERWTSDRSKRGCTSLLSLIEMGDDGLKRAREAIANATATLALEDVTLLAPIPRPRKNIMCVGMNYVDHAYESARCTWRARNAAASSGLLHQGRDSGQRSRRRRFRTMPRCPSNRLGSRACRGAWTHRQGHSRSQALDYVWGYTIVNDVSVRDIQNKHQQFFKGKSLDGTCPMGPMIVTADEVGDPHTLRLTLRVNGKTMQDSNTNDLIFNIPTLLSVLSRGQTLEAGDILATGTPSGVGMGHTPPTWLVPGDVMEAEIEKLGVLRNRVGA